jgi:hypothetical protein
MQPDGDGVVPWTEPTLVISLDFELAWGSFDHSHGPALLAMARWTHDHGAPALLEQLTRNGLSATWATVGVAMLDRLPDVSGLAPVSAGGHDWFSYVPAGATEATAPEWFAGSFVRALLAARPRQEVGFHGFSHVVLGDPALPPARARQELEACAELARRLGIEAPSFVFPRNSIGHLDALRAAGIACYRGLDELPVPLPGRSAMRAWWLAADLLALPPPIVRPRIEGGLVNIPGSLMVRYVAGWRRHVPDRLRLRRLRSGLARLRARGGIFHVWLHPENMYFERPRLERVLADFFAEAADLAASERIRVLTMGEVARAVRARHLAAAQRRSAT